MVKRIFSVLILYALVCASLASCNDSGNDTVTSENTDISTSTDTSTETESVTTSDPAVTYDTSASAVLNAAIAAGTLPDGTSYVYTSDEADEDTAMNAISFCNYFGYTPELDDSGENFAFPAIHDKIDEYAFRKPSSSQEYASVDIIKSNDADSLETLCKDRIALIKSNYSKNGVMYDSDGSKKAIVDNASYKIVGNFGIIVCASDADAIFSAAETAITTTKAE